MFSVVVRVRVWCSSVESTGLYFPVTSRGQVAPSLWRLSFRLVLCVRSSWLSSLQVVIGSVWLLSPCPFSAAGAGDRSSLIHRWCGAYLRVNFRLHLWSAHCRFQVFGVWSLAWVIANTDFDGMVSVLVCTLSLPSIRSLLFSCRCDS